MFDFVENLGLGSKGLNGHKEIIVSLIFDDEITFVFGVRQPDGWKVSINEFVIIKGYETFFKLYEDVYTHLPPNSDYPNVFLRGWLVQRKGIE